jgi:hypothetical protein
MITPPPYTDAPGYTHELLDLVQGQDLIAELEASKQYTLDLMRRISLEQENFAYAEGKWTIKQLFRHIIDCEYVYSYRAFRFSRFDATELSGFDVDEYLKRVEGLDYHMPDLIAEYTALRDTTIALFKFMQADMLDFKGKANGVMFSPRVLGYYAVGHNLRHCQVLEARYLSQF